MPELKQDIKAYELEAVQSPDQMPQGLRESRGWYKIIEVCRSKKAKKKH